VNYTPKIEYNPFLSCIFGRNILHIFHMNRIHKFLDRNRFELLIIALVFLIFDVVFFPDREVYLKFVWPVNMIFITIACFGVFHESNRILNQVKNILTIISLLMPFGFIMFSTEFWFIQTLSIFFANYYLFIFVEVMRQITKAEEVRLNVVFGSFSGYLLLALIALFTFIVIELNHSNSFHGISTGNTAKIYNELSYFSFVTLTSIGFGDIYPLTDSARLVTAFFGMLGQFYMVAVVGIIISKFTSK
jgi:voltage-gated potassium channel